MACFLNTILYTLRHWISGGTHIVEGHTYKNEEVMLDRVVMIDRCVDCGKVTISHMSRDMYEIMKAEGKIQYDSD